mgnify:CR=1 FL=1
MNGFNSPIHSNVNEEENEEEAKPITNLPYPLLGPKVMNSACYSLDFYKLGNKKEYMACGCGDGGVRLFTIEK